MAANAILSRSNDQQGGGNKAGKANRFYTNNKKQERPNGNNTTTSSGSRRNVSTMVTLQETSYSYAADRSSLVIPATNDTERTNENDDREVADSNVLQGHDDPYRNDQDNDVQDVDGFGDDYEDDNDEDEFDFDDMDALPTESFQSPKKNDNSVGHSRGEQVCMEDQKDEEEAV